MTRETDERADARTQAEALVEDYERRVSTDLLERDWLVGQIAAFAVAREAEWTARSGGRLSRRSERVVNAEREEEMHDD